MKTALCIACAVLAAAAASAQGSGSPQVVDRVAARVNGSLILLSDVRAAAALGIVEPGPESDQVRQLIRRQLLVGEITRFPPQEPATAAVQAEVGRMLSRLADPAALRRDHGLSDGQLEALARESLRIEAYLAQRFGSSLPVTDDLAREYYGAHVGEFTRNGVLAPFESVQGEARERAAVARRRDAVSQWVIELEGRADIVVPGAKR